VVGEVVGLLQSCVLVFLSVLIVRSTGSFTRKAALYGNPIGMFAKIASTRLANGDRKAKLWEIS
jgi:hypothetical protein